MYSRMSAFSLLSCVVKHMSGYVKGHMRRAHGRTHKAAATKVPVVSVHCLCEHALARVLTHGCSHLPQGGAFGHCDDVSSDSDEETEDAGDGTSSYYVLSLSPCCFYSCRCLCPVICMLVLSSSVCFPYSYFRRSEQI